MAANPLKRLRAWPPFQKAMGVLFAEYFRLVWATTRVAYEPPDFKERSKSVGPVIVGMWHGQHFLMPFLDRHRGVKVLISRHRDGEINAIAAERMGVELIRGSGAHSGDIRRKGGVQAFFEMQEALQQGYDVALTADVPKVARVVGRGIVALAAASKRPIYVVAIATRNRLTLKTWDRSALNLPFGRAAVVGAGPIEPPATASDADLEAARRAVEDALNVATARAYAMVDGPAPAAHEGG
ncbi:MAG: lysophospholipid acyltransferase family protein [Hyphomicrobiales bacterium]|nr:lysophospholipid acyltransferase family protein [Hyphomicrobiales bacterium]